MPRKSIWDGSSNRCPACITAPRVPTCWPSMNHASYLRPVGVSFRSIRGARSLNRGSMRLAYRSGGSMMWESAEMSLYVAIAPSSVNRSGHSCTRRLSPCPPPARGHGTPVGPRCQKRLQREAESRAKQQTTLTESELSISIQTNQGKADYARAQQQAAQIQTLAQAEAEKIRILGEGEAKKVQALAGAEAERAARVGIAQAMAIDEQVRAYGGPRFQLTH